MQESAWQLPPASSCRNLYALAYHLACATSALTASGISRCSSTAPADEIAARASSPSCHGAVLAPPWSMMRFWPARCEVERRSEERAGWGCRGKGGRGRTP